MATTAEAISGWEAVQTASQVLIAFATVALSVIGRIYATVQQTIEERNAARAAVQEACRQVDARFPALFFRRTYDNGTGNTRAISDGDYERIMDAKVTYLDGDQAAMRASLVMFLENVRAASFIASAHLPVAARHLAGGGGGGFSQRFAPNVRVWHGKFDPATTNLRIAVRELAAFWNNPHIGGQESHETRRAYIKSVFGNDEEWRRFCSVAVLFDDSGAFGPKPSSSNGANVNGGVVDVQP